MTDAPRMTLDDAVRHMRADPRYADLVRFAYLGADVEDSARRFEASGEFAAVLALAGADVRGAVVVDVGAGTGIAALAFARRGARRVLAVEPDTSDEVGQGALRRLRGDAPIEIVSAYAEALPIADGAADMVYARQVLHHTRDLPRALREAARVLKPGGLLIACREHVVDDEEQLRAFLASHPVHQLAGGENAYSLAAYVSAIRGAGLELTHRLAPWDSVINAFPTAQTDEEVRGWPRARLRARFGAVGGVLAAVPGVAWAVRRRLNAPVPGRMYTFAARRPA